MRPEYKLVRRENTSFAGFAYLCRRKSKRQTDMEVSFIIAVACATVLMLIFIGLAVAVAYYRWRTTELMTGISAFIRKNWEIEQQIEQLEKKIRNINQL